VFVIVGRLALGRPLGEQLDARVDVEQALEDELRGYAADEVVLLTAGDKDPLGKVEARIGLPLRRVSV